MIIRPILFNTEMVQAIQEGRKTVTRRLAKDLSRPPYETGDIPSASARAKLAAAYGVSVAEINEAVDGATN